MKNPKKQIEVLKSGNYFIYLILFKKL